MRTASTRCLMLCLLVAVSIRAVAQTPSIIGTWILDVKASTFTTPYAIRSEQFTVQAVGNAVKVITDVRISRSIFIRTYHSEFTAKYDGQRYPMIGLDDVDTVTLRIIDPSTVERIDRKGERIVQRLTRRLSDDGKTLHVQQEVFRGDTRYVNQLVFRGKG
jgi:hypothetical protein